MPLPTAPLVQSINWLAIGALKPLADKFPELTAVINSNKEGLVAWDFFMTVAGVGFYLIRHNLNLSEIEQVVNEIEEFDSKGIAGLENFYSFMEIDKENQIEKYIRTGLWVIWSIKGK